MMTAARRGAAGARRAAEPVDDFPNRRDNCVRGCLLRAALVLHGQVSPSAASDGHAERLAAHRRRLGGTW
jgi:hypothetical protein